MKRTAVVLLSLTLFACGEAPAPTADERAAADGGWLDPALTPEPGFDMDDPALQTVPDDGAHGDEIVRRAGTRKDFKVPARAVAGLPDGPLVRAVVLRPFHEDDTDVLRKLNDAQRAVYALYVADLEILNGGLMQLWQNEPDVAAEVVAAAERVGAEEHAAIFRDAASVLGPDPGAVDGEQLAALDARYAALQFKRATALATVLGRYIRGTSDQFVAG